MKINSLSRDDALRSLGSSENGLADAEAAKRLGENGFNEIRETHRPHFAARFLKQFTHFLALLLWVGAGLSFFSAYLHPGEGMATLGFAIIGVIVINAVFTFFQEYRAEKAFAELQKLLPFNVTVLRERREKKIPARELVPGDIILLAEGERIPADARIIEAHFLKINNASLTGESEPLLRESGPSQGELLESINIVFAGTTVLSGSGKALVFATGMSTEFGRIAHLTSAVESGLSPLQKEIVKVTRLIAVLATAMGVAFFLIGHLIGREFWGNFIFAIGIIIANVPEGLLPTVTLSLAMGSQRMAKRKALIKTLTSVEALGAVSVICTDKTGTLTRNSMTAKKIWTDGQTVEAGNFPAQKSDMLMQTALLCTHARFSDGRYTGDPTEAALLELAREKIGDLDASYIAEIPFDPERKRMTTIYRSRGDLILFSKGAMENLMPLCSRYLSHGVVREIDEPFRLQATHACHQLMDAGLRVLAFAYRTAVSYDQTSLLDRNDASACVSHITSLETDLVFAGLIGLEDPPRPEVPEAIRKCHEAGIKVVVITGDGSRTAVAIAREIGLIQGDPVVVEGHEFTILSDRELKERLANREVIFSRMTPRHKMRVVSALQENSERVAVTGDGVNDAPALKKADIGIAMGISGTDVAKEASDMILLDDNFATIVNAIEEGRAVYENIRKFISYIFSSNIPEIVPYIAYALLKIPLPLTVMQILAVDLGTDMLPALALGAEKPTPDLMKQPPRKPDERLLTFSLLGRAYLFLGPIEAAAAMFGFFYVLSAGGWQWGTDMPATSVLYLQATTACLTAIIITQTANIFACRSFRESAFRIGFFSNRLIYIGIVFELLLQLFIVYHPWGNRIFSTYAISPGLWLALAPFAFFLFFAEEARKALVRSR